MVDEPNGDNETKERKQQSSIVQKTSSEGDEATRASPQKQWRKVLSDWIKADPAAFITALATAAIAAFTIVLVWATIVQNRESDREYLFTHRARIVVAVDSIEIQDFGNEVETVVSVRNDGGAPAIEVDPYILPLVTTSTVNFDYSQLQQPKVGFRPGVAIGQGQTVKFYGRPITKDQESMVKNSTAGFRLIGRIAYWDDFGYYCQAFAATYFTPPPRFVPDFVPPDTAVCNPDTVDGEEFTWDAKQRLAGVGFKLLPTEHLSHAEPETRPIPQAFP